MIRYIQIYGERRSGTNFLTSLVEKNFANVEITKAFGGKHWFIKDHFPRSGPNESTDYQCSRPLTDSGDTLFIVIFRNPLDWLRSIHSKPYHAGNHWNLTLSEFIRKRWISYESLQLNQSWLLNAENYYFIEDAENVLQLRTQKIVHLKNLEGTVQNVCYLNYESVTTNNDILKEIADRFSITLTQRSIVGEPEYLEGGGRTGTAFSAKEFAPISTEDLAFIDANLDWGLEEGIGYRRSDYR